MKFYPINLNLKTKKILIVGAGRVALRKFKHLLKTGAQIKVVSPEFNRGFTPYFKREEEAVDYIFLKRIFKEADLKDKFMVFAAADDSELNQKIALLARSKNILVNIVDDSDLSDFTLPAVVERGELLLTASSGSNLPALSKNIKEKLASEFGIEYQILLEIMKKRRIQLITKIDEISKRKEIFRKLASDQFLERIREIVKQSTLDLSEFKGTAEIFSSQSKVSNLELKQILTKVEAEIDKIIAELRDD